MSEDKGDKSIWERSFYQKTAYLEKEGAVNFSLCCQMPTNSDSSDSPWQPLPSDAAQLFFDFFKTERLPTNFKFEVVYRTLENAGHQVQLRSSDITKCMDDQPISSCRFEKQTETKFFIHKDSHAIEVLFDPNTKEEKFLEEYKWMEKAGRISHKFEVTSIGPGKSLCVKDKISISRFLPGEYCPVILPPGFQKMDCVPKHALVIGNSFYKKQTVPKGEGEQFKEEPFKIEEKVNNEIWDIYENEISTLLRLNEKGTIILVQGPPGSGKDGVAKAIHFGAVRDAPDKFEAISVAGMPLSDLRSRLFGFERDGDFIEGLIARTDGGTLMLDEIDKAATDNERPDFYRMLLRVLESHEYHPVNARQPKKISKLCWVLAGAFSEEESVVVVPDFWSRLSHLIRIRNPLDSSLKERRSYAMSLFLWFHFQETANWVNTNSMKWMLSGSDEGSVTEKIGKVLLFNGEQKKEFETKPIEPGNDQAKFAEEFSKLIMPKDGIRSVRQAALAASRSLRASVIAESGVKVSWPEGNSIIFEEALEKANETLELNRGNLA